MQYGKLCSNVLTSGTRRDVIIEICSNFSSVSAFDFDIRSHMGNCDSSVSDYFVTSFL